MQEHTIDGHPRTSRRYRTYDSSPLPTMADKLLFILTYLKQNPIQEVQGQLLGMSQANANKWLHLLHTVLNQTLAQQELLPARTAAELATFLARKQTKEVPTVPLFGMMVLNDPSTTPKIQQNNKTITVGRRKATRSTTSS
jgi:Helix-turn-helix of DDE superfamily endonuclease